MSDYWGAAHHAVEHEDAETLARLLAGGSDPNEVFTDGRTPMGMAEHYGHDLAVRLLQAHISGRATDEFH